MDHKLTKNDDSKNQKTFSPIYTIMSGWSWIGKNVTTYIDDGS
jgi:hypothetical protein